MKKLIILMLSASSLAYLFACDGKSSNQSSCEMIFIEDLTVKNINLEDLFGRIQFISLDKNNQFIPGAAKTIYKNDRIYLSDGEKVYTFKTNGDLLHTIDKKGKASSEYLGVTDFDVTADKIIILDRNSQNILMYNQEGEFLSGIKLNLFASTFVAQNDSILIVNNDYSYSENPKKSKFTMVNMRSKETSDFGELNLNKINYMHILGGSNFYKSNNKLYFYENYSPYVYQIDGGNMVKSKDIRFYNTPKDEYYDSNFGDVVEFMNSFQSNRYASGISNFYCDDSRIIFKFNYDKMLYYCSYNRKNKGVDFLGTIYLCDGSVAINNINFNSDKAILGISAYRLLDAMKTNEKIADLVKKYNITDESCPLLLILDDIK